MVTPLTFPSTLIADEQVTLRLAQDSDAELISSWTRAPEVNEFWAGRVVPVDEVLAKYTGRRLPAVVSYVIHDAANPVGYLQAWQHAGRFGLDMFIAAEAQGRTVGPRAARALALELSLRGWTPLTVDPAVDNARAISAWRAAGFVPTGEFSVDNGRRTRVMTFRGPSARSDSHVNP